MYVHNLLKAGQAEIEGSLLSEVSARLRGRGATIFLLAICKRGPATSLAVFRTINLLQQCLIEMPCVLRGDLTLCDGVHLLGSTENNVFSPSAIKQTKAKRSEVKALVSFSAVQDPDATRMRRSTTVCFSTWGQKVDTFDLFLLGAHGLAPNHLLLFQAESVINSTGTIAFRARLDRTTIEDMQNMENTLPAQSKNVCVIPGATGVTFRYQKAVEGEGNVRADLESRIVADIFHSDASAVRFSRFAQRIPGRPSDVILWILVLGDSHELAHPQTVARVLQVTGYVFVQANYANSAAEPMRFAYCESTLTFFMNGQQRREVVDVMERSAEQFGRRMERYTRSRPMKRGEAERLRDEPPAKVKKTETQGNDGV